MTNPADFPSRAQKLDPAGAGSIPPAASTLPAAPPPPSGQPEPGRWMRLVPVEHFGEDADCDGCGARIQFAYGLTDAVQAWSDCNRAVGHIFRVDDVDPQHRQPGETIRIWVPEQDVPALVETVWGEDGAPPTAQRADQFDQLHATVTAALGRCQAAEREAEAAGRNGDALLNHARVDCYDWVLQRIDEIREGVALEQPELPPSGRPAAGKVPWSAIRDAVRCRDVWDLYNHDQVTGRHGNTDPWLVREIARRIRNLDAPGREARRDGLAADLEWLADAHEAGLTHPGLAGSADATVAHGNLVTVLTVADRVWFGTPTQARALAAGIVRQADHADTVSST